MIDSISTIHLQLLIGKACIFYGMQNARPKVDLVLIDCLENLLVSRVSSIPMEVLEWNEDKENEVLQSTFTFTFKHLQSTVAL